MLQKRKEKNCSLDRSFSGWWCAHAVVCARRTLPALYNSTPLRRLAAGVTASCLLCACCHTRGRFDHLNTFVPCGGRQASSGRKFERLAQLGVHPSLSSSANEPRLLAQACKAFAPPASSLCNDRSLLAFTNRLTKFGCARPNASSALPSYSVRLDETSVKTGSHAGTAAEKRVRKQRHQCNY